jgi:hypothetical protein
MAESHLCSKVTITLENIQYYLQFPAAILDHGVRHLRFTTPFAAFHFPEGKFLARLACLIHAANVHSEPESNPSNVSIKRNPKIAILAIIKFDWRCFRLLQNTFSFYNSKPKKISIGFTNQFVKDQPQKQFTFR